MLNSKKIKIWISAIFLIVAVSFLVACTQNNTELVITDASIEMNDGKFTGVETHTVKLSANDVIIMDTRGNVFDVLIIDESETPMPFFGKGISGSNLKGTIVEDGEYTITIEGSGRFKISWK